MRKSDLTKEELSLLQIIKSIQKKLWSYTFMKHKRVNPTFEDITNWKAKGEFLFGKKNITVYDSASIVGNVEIGENTWVGPFTALDGTGGIKIGQNCSISSGVSIVSHDSIKWALSGGKEKYEYDKIAIGDNCFIGTRAFICKGVSIGDKCLVAAGAVVTKTFPSFTIIGGIPAKKIGDVVENEKGKIEFHYINGNKNER